MFSFPCESLQQGIEETRRSERSGSAMHLDNVPAGDDIASAKVFEDDAVAHANFFGIDLHKIRDAGWASI
jgi:hypothetical protein